MIIIPARLKSVRFPNKILADLNGIPLVIATAKVASSIDETIIATDSSEVIDISKSYKIDAIKIDKRCKSGTQRVYEATKALRLDSNTPIINLQADEPFIEPKNIRIIFKQIKERISKDTIMVSCYKNISYKDSLSKDIVKVIVDKNSDAIYFSRNQIPFSKDEETLYLGHVGIYGFKVGTLDEFCNLDDNYLESREELEQLRAIYSNKKISMVHINTRSFGIDTYNEYKKALDFIKLYNIKF